ncbi:unnamed protein product [Brugia pahangi]|uniref:Serine/threonine-protein phosphatase 2A activator n=1 Tax=Brugia pahangi TaxID=6280 RepID=A0A0N4TC72_BRUPA|nr:unnamed protein product [Brugia pahangi]
MYEAEVLKKFPVVQHFQFGSLFSIEPVKEMDDPNLIGTVQANWKWLVQLQLKRAKIIRWIDIQNCIHYVESRHYIPLKLFIEIYQKNK